MLFSDRKMSIPDIFILMELSVFCGSTAGGAFEKFTHRIFIGKSRFGCDFAERHIGFCEKRVDRFELYTSFNLAEAFIIFSQA